MYVLHRDPKYFYPSPEEFNPNRWLAHDSKEKGESMSSNGFIHNTAAFIPFSVGPMNCLGKQVAYREMSVIIANILRRFDMRLAEDFDPEMFLNKTRDYMVLTKGPLRVVLTRKT